MTSFVQSSNSMTKEELIYQIDELFNESLESVMERERTTFDRLAGDNCNELILYGTGKLGRRTLLGLRKLGIKPLAFCDKNSGTWGKDVEGLKVLSPEEAVKTYGAKGTFVVTIWNDKLGHPLNEVSRGLKSWGDVKIVSFLSLYWKYPKQFLPYFSADLPQNTHRNKNQIKFVANLLTDSYSRECFLGHIKWRLNGDFKYLLCAIDERQYFTKSIYNIATDEVFVDCGAYNGDTLRDFLMLYNSIFSKYYALEPDSKNREKLNRYIDSLEYTIRSKINVLDVAASNENGKLKFNNSGAIDSSVSDQGDSEVDCMTLDKVAGKNPISFIKIDIEGAELNAINGAKRVISKFSPIIAIAAYHNPNDIWLILYEIQKIYDSYLYFIRPHAAGGWENILYCIPHNRSTHN